ncbi:MAG TPA: hypothetical protein VKA50_03495 [Gammaproteobacteria bacterium]|nr:hypothetical protein [Gammaproteobacteria bacterium]
MSSTPRFQPYGEAPPPADQLTRIADIDPRLTRTNYFDGRLLTAEDLNRDQTYLDGRLREMGRAVGDGVVRGLTPTLNADKTTIEVSPGLAINAAGRVLELDRTLNVRITDRAAIGALNDGRYRHLRRGLYAVVLCYAEVGTGIAEVFPTDLGARRRASYDTISEGVELGLVALPEPLAQGREISNRAALARSLIGRPGGLIPAECVALGVLAISDDQPQWLDAELLRHPARAAGTERISRAAINEDLARHYESLLRAVLTDRQEAGLKNDFAAREYFQLLPPSGAVPKDAIDPQTTRQGFFPENFDVWLAPVRVDDLPALRAEAMTLPPFDLNAGEPADVVVLAPLSEADYGHFLPQLEGLVTTREQPFPALELFKLRLHPITASSSTDPHAAAAQQMWASLAAAPVYVRRASRAAETGVSAVVLARGFDLPPVPDMPPRIPVPPPIDTGVPQPRLPTTSIFNERAALLKRVNLDVFSSLRPPPKAADQEAYKRLLEKFGKDDGAVLDIMALLIRIERHYDPVIWPTLALWADKSLLGTTRKLLQEKQQPDQKTGKTMVEAAAELGLSGDLLSRWKKLAETGP